MVVGVVVGECGGSEVRFGCSPQNRLEVVATRRWLRRSFSWVLSKEKSEKRAEVKEVAVRMEEGDPL